MSQPEVTVQARQARLILSPDAVVIHKNGIEFRSPTPLAPWKEMTVELQADDDAKVNCAGVVIACTGNKHSGYHISLVFTSLSKQAQLRLTSLAAAGLD
jgi:hypothetical protein